MLMCEKSKSVAVSFLKQRIFLPLLTSLSSLICKLAESKTRYGIIRFKPLYLTSDSQNECGTFFHFQFPSRLPG